MNAGSHAYLDLAGAGVGSHAYPESAGADVGSHAYLNSTGADVGAHAYLDSAGEVQSDDSHGYGMRHCSLVMEFLCPPCMHDTPGVRTEWSLNAHQYSWVWSQNCEDLPRICGIATAQFVDLKVNHNLLARRRAGMAESVCCRNRRRHASNTPANPSVP